MNIKPYNEIYLEDVESNIGSMLEYSACCEFDPTVIWEYFIHSKIAREIERGNPKYLAGYSGREYLEILIIVAKSCLKPNPNNLGRLFLFIIFPILIILATTSGSLEELRER